ncbi:hypothetical protein J6590_068446 [Homalodisca vitripennis]|nr:hypothetical protein J6590_068446 [Homalodisca vitripennis]
MLGDVRQQSITGASRGYSKGFALGWYHFNLPPHRRFRPRGEFVTSVTSPYRTRCHRSPDKGTIETSLRTGLSSF